MHLDRGGFAKTLVFSFGLKAEPL